MSSLTGGSRGGTQERTGAGPRTTSGVIGPTAKACRPCGSTRPPGSSAASARLSQPVSAAPGFGQAAFEHVLPVEMRALAIGRRDRVHDRRLSRLIEAVQVRHRRVQREKAVERQSRGLAVGGQRFFAAQLGPIGIADRRDDREPIERAAQHNRQKPRVAALGAGEARHRGPGEQHARAEQQFASCRSVEG